MHVTIAQNANIEEEERDGVRYLIAKGITIAKNQQMDKGYLPTDSIEKSTELENTHGGTGWNGVPITLQHPRNESGKPWYTTDKPDGKAILSSNAGVVEEYGIGQLESQRVDGGELVTDLAFNTEKLSDIGSKGDAVMTALEDDEPLDVSTQYATTRLPPGEYDGEYREQAAAIVAPDALAVLPDSSGRCSTEDGCGVNPVAAPIGVAANVELDTGHVSTNDAEASVRRGLGGKIKRSMRELSEAFGMWQSLDRKRGGSGVLTDTDHIDGIVSDVSANESVAGVTFTCTQTGDLDESAIDKEETNLSDHYLYGSGDNKSDYTYPVVGADGCLYRGNVEGAWKLGCRGLCDDAEQHDERLKKLGKEFDDNPIPADAYETSENTMDRADFIEAIVGQTEIKKESLEGMGDQCLKTTYENVVAANEDPDIPDGKTLIDDDELEELRDNEPAVDEDRIEELVEERVAANRERREKEDRVETIVANSAEYDDKDELMETPDSVLERIESGLGGGIELPDASGGEAMVGANEESLDDADFGTGRIGDIAEGDD